MNQHNNENPDFKRIQAEIDAVFNEYLNLNRKDQCPVCFQRDKCPFRGHPEGERQEFCPYNNKVVQQQLKELIRKERLSTLKKKAKVGIAIEPYQDHLN